MDNVSEMIWEYIYAIVFMLGLAFLFFMSTKLIRGTDYVNDDIRTKLNVEEDVMGYTGLNVVDRSTVIFDIAAAAKEMMDTSVQETGEVDDEGKPIKTALTYSIMINNTESENPDYDKTIPRKVIVEASNGKLTRLMELVTEPTYKKVYRQDSTGAVSVVKYVKYTPEDDD